MINSGKRLFWRKNSSSRQKLLMEYAPHVITPGVLVSLFEKHYRCVTCGSDLETESQRSYQLYSDGKS